MEEPPDEKLIGKLVDW